MTPPPTEFWFPGGIRILEQVRNDNRAIDFPDNVEARNWLLGFDRTLSAACPATKETESEIAQIINKVQMQDLLKGPRQIGRKPMGKEVPHSILATTMAYPLAYSAYVDSVRAEGPIGPEGPQDARLLVRKAGCVNAQRYMINDVIVILYSSKTAVREDTRQFLQLATPRFRSVLGYTGELEAQVMHMGQEIKLVSQRVTETGISLVTAGRYGRDLSPDEQTVIRDQLYAENARGQQIVNCFYNSGHNYYFWFGSIPRDYDQLVHNQSDHPFRNLGRGAISACPATEDLARQQCERIDKLSQ